MTEDENYIICMPFIDMKKIHRLNVFYNEKEQTKRHIDILTL